MAHHHDHSGHHHGHSHGHGHVHEMKTLNTAFIVGIGLNLLFVIVEVVMGLNIHSLSLLSDAGHNLADVGSLALSLLAFRLLRAKANDKYTYGYRKTTILTALFNAVVLLLSIGAIVYEALHRIFNPEPLPGKTIALVAGIGIVINAFTAFLFMKDKEKDLNVKSAYLHLMADALVSAALVVGGLVIAYTGWFWLDPVLSIGVAIVILVGTWHLLRGSLRLSLDGVPEEIELQEVKKEITGVAGVSSVHHMHVWAMSTTENAMTVHLILDDQLTRQQEFDVKHEVRHRMEHMNIRHVTIETESKGLDCGKEDC